MYEDEISPMSSLFRKESILDEYTNKSINDEEETSRKIDAIEAENVYGNTNLTEKIYENINLCTEESNPEPLLIPEDAKYKHQLGFIINKTYVRSKHISHQKFLTGSISVRKNQMSFIATDSNKKLETNNSRTKGRSSPKSGEKLK
jgi:hypothetical protein